MFTLTETIDKIKALDTDADIITQACAKVLGHGTSALAPANIAHEIIEKYKKNRPSDVIEGLCAALALLLAASAEEGHEINALASVGQMLSAMYGKAMVDRIRRDCDANPTLAVRRIMGLLNTLDKQNITK